MQKTDLLEKIEERLRAGERVIVAIDGGAASGKTTFADVLSKRYKGTVIHMDDFFLRPEQRTEERFAEAGGNVDYERFLAEVITKLRAAEEFSYRRFDCSNMALGEYISVPKASLLIVEGSYSHHPVFGDAYDLRIFLDVDEEIRKARILKRNGVARYEMFCTRWIPLENRYFSAFSIREKADIVIEG